MKAQNAIATATISTVRMFCARSEHVAATKKQRAPTFFEAFGIRF
jgi:hypothetical protein